MQDRNPRMKLLHSAKARSKRDKLPFNLTKFDIIIPEFCPILGIKLEWGKGYCTDNSPSLDKIVPELGYVTGNVIVVSFRANTLKSNGTVEEHKKVADWMQKWSIGEIIVPVTTDQERKDQIQQDREDKNRNISLAKTGRIPRPLTPEQLAAKTAKRMKTIEQKKEKGEFTRKSFSKETRQRMSEGQKTRRRNLLSKAA